jgi:hypothetical protein
MTAVPKKQYQPAGTPVNMRADLLVEPDKVAEVPE